jgi:hypothetical protein
MSTAALVTCVEGAPEHDERFLRLWHQVDDLLRGRGGYRTTRLHAALGPQARFRIGRVIDARRSSPGEPCPRVGGSDAPASPSPGAGHTRPASWTQIAIWTRLVISSLTRMWETWALTVARLM